MEFGFNFTIAMAQTTKDPRLALAIATVQTSAGKVVEVGQNYLLWNTDKVLMKAQIDQLNNTFEQTKSAAEMAKVNGDHATYSRLMKSAIGIEQSIGILGQAANEIP